MKNLPELFLSPIVTNGKIQELTLSLTKTKNTLNKAQITLLEEVWLNNELPLPDFINQDLLKPFQKKVLETLRKTKPGHTLSYQELAIKTGYPKAARAVGRALATNPFLLLFPCHRVIKKDGTLGNFSAGKNKEEGIKIKKILLKFEKNRIR